MQLFCRKCDVIVTGQLKELTVCEIKKAGDHSPASIYAGALLTYQFDGFNFISSCKLQIVTTRPVLAAI